MNTTPRSPLTRFGLVPLAAAAALFLSGCHSTPVMVRAASTNEVAIVRTNVIALLSTNAVESRLNDRWTTNLVVVTNYAVSLYTNIITLVSPPVYYTNVSLAPWVEPAAKLTGELVPVPGASGVVGVALGLAGGIFGAINSRRRKRALGEATTWQETAAELVRNVESVRKEAQRIPGYTPEIDARIVRGLELSQWATGTKPRITALVDQHTDFTTGP